MSIINMILILAIWFMCLLQFLGRQGEKVRWFCWLYVVQIYLFREADFHSAFTEIHITKATFYTAESIPIVQKLIVGAITVGFIVCLVALLIKHARGYLEELKRQVPWAVALCLWFVCLIASQLLDKSPLNESPYWQLRVIEEMLEITAAIYAFTAINFYISNTNATTSTRP